MKDYYEVLGVPKSASGEEVKKAFHRLAHKHHPHKGGDEKKFKEINEAYQVLSDKEKRAQYDQFGQVFEGGNPGAGSQGFGFQWGQQGANMDFDLGDLGDLFGDLFGTGFGASSKKRGARKGKDLQIDLEIPLEATLKGLEKEITLHHHIICSRCQGKGAEPGTKLNECFTCRGSGQVQQIKRTVFGSLTRSTVCPECQGEGNRPEKNCNVCKGEGRIKNEEEIKIFIPAGSDNNQVITIEGKGEAGKKGAKTGDLYIRIFVKPHPVFKRNGDDLFYSAPVTLTQAALSGEIEVPLLEGTKILLRVPEGVESGKVLRISGKGIPHFQSFGRGNLYVELIIKTPKKLTKKQKELLEELKKKGL